MEKKTSDLSFEVLKRLEKAGILKSIILIGSWSIYFYKYYFRSATYSTYIRTHDIDFLVPIPVKINKKIDIFDLVRDLGFIMDFRGSKGYIKLAHPDLTIEFLVPELGRGSDKPYPIPQFGINAQPLRYLEFLLRHTISVKAEDLHIIIPHPAAYILHKFIIFKRRKGKDKHDRDFEGALRVYHELIKENKQSEIIRIFKTMHSKWQRTVLRNLETAEEDEIISLLTQ